jgi:uncharacterized protein YjbJ (UPF0337 family)
MHGGRELVFEGTLDKNGVNSVNGAANEIAGRAKRQTGEWTGDAEAQVEGVGREAKGKAQKAWGDLKDAVQNVGNRASNRPAKRTNGTRLNRA